MVEMAPGIREKRPPADIPFSTAKAMLQRETVSVVTDVGGRAERTGVGGMLRRAK